MKLKQMIALKIYISFTVITLVLFAGNGSVHARKNGNKNSDERGKRKSRRNRARRRDMEQPPHDDMLSLLHSSRLNAQKQEQSNSTTTTSSKKTSKSVEVTSWTEAMVKVSSGGDDISISHSAFGKFGYHSKTESVSGKVVHLHDPNLKTHYGCNHYIGNREQIPKGEPWIALIERGKCYFFNKIRLSEVNKAVAVVIYNDRKGRTEIMNTAGTRAVSLMISKEDGHKIIAMVDAGSSVTMKIDVGRSHNTSHDNGSPPHQPTTRAPIITTTGEMHENISIMKEVVDNEISENLHLLPMALEPPPESASVKSDIDFTRPNDATQLRVFNLRIIVFFSFCALLCAALNVT